MINYTEINGIKISIQFLGFLKQYKFGSIPTVGFIFISTLLGDYTNNSRFIKHFSKIKKIHCLDDGYVLINDNQKVKLGRILTKIAKSEFGVNYNQQTTSSYIEDFINIYKSWYKLFKLKFKYLKGEDILKGYDKDNYTTNYYSMLHSSCMNNKFNYLKLYTKNPDKVSLLVLVDDEDRIYGRSLVWKIDNKNYQFMDRVYGANDYVINMFKNYAIEHKMAYRSNEHSFRFKIYKPDSKISYSNRNTLKVKLKINDIKRYPYVDSLHNLDVWSGTLSNSIKTFSKTYELSNTYGSKDFKGIRIFGMVFK